MVFIRFLFVLCGVGILVASSSLTMASPTPNASAVLYDVLEWAEQENVVDPTQKEKLWEEWRVRWQEASGAPSTLHYAFHAVSSRLTLTNVLSFGGALLVIGSMTLFMVTGWEIFGGLGIFAISSFYILALSITGIYLFDGKEYAQMGGLLCTAAVCLVPLAVYGLQKRSLGEGTSYADFYVWVRGSFVPMEMATCIVGALMVWRVPFPFLTMPIGFALWFASMDLTPWLVGSHRNWSWEERMNVSVIFGLHVVALGFWVERTFGTTNDFAFWLYLFGLKTLSSGIHMRRPVVNGSMQFFQHMIMAALVWLGSPTQLNRTTFLVFGVPGYVLVHIEVFMALVTPHHRRIQRPSFFWWLMGIFPLVLALAAAISFPPDSTAGRWMLLAALLGVLLHAAQGWFLAQARGEVVYLFILAIFLGGLLGVPVLQRPMGRLSFGFSDAFWPTITFTLACLPVHTALLAEMVLPLPALRHKLYLTYRLVLSLALAMCPSPVLPFTATAVLGASGFVAHVAILHARGGVSSTLDRILHFGLGVLVILLGKVVDESCIFLLGVGVVCFVLFQTWDSSRSHRMRPLFVFFSLCLFLLAVPLQSRLLVGIGGLLLFRYLAHLSRHIFQSSVAFPFVLSILGLILVRLAMFLQKYGDSIYTAFMELSALLLPDVARPVLAWIVQILTGTLWQSLPSDSFILSVHRWLAWPSYVLVPLANAPEIGRRVFAVVFAGYLFLEVLTRWVRLPTVDTSAPPVVNVDTVTITFPTDTQGHGIVFRVRGRKPRDFTLRQAWLMIEGDTLWQMLESSLGPTLVSMFKMTLYPVKLCDSMLQHGDFQAGSTNVEAMLRLGTGTAGGPRISHRTMEDRLRVMEREWDDPNVTLRVIAYPHGPWRSPVTVFTVAVRPSELLRVRNSGSL